MSVADELTGPTWICLKGTRPLFQRLNSGLPTLPMDLSKVPARKGTRGLLSASQSRAGPGQAGYSSIDHRGRPCTYYRAVTWYGRSFGLKHVVPFLLQARRQQRTRGGESGRGPQLRTAASRAGVCREARPRFAARPREPPSDLVSLLCSSCASDAITRHTAVAPALHLRPRDLPTPIKTGTRHLWTCASGGLAESVGHQ